MSEGTARAQRAARRRLRVRPVSGSWQREQPKVRGSRPPKNLEQRTAVASRRSSCRPRPPARTRPRRPRRATRCTCARRGRGAASAGGWQTQARVAPAGARRDVRREGETPDGAAPAAAWLAVPRCGRGADGVGARGGARRAAKPEPALKAHKAPGSGLRTHLLQCAECVGSRQRCPGRWHASLHCSPGARLPNSAGAFHSSASCRSPPSSASSASASAALPCAGSRSSIMPCRCFASIAASLCFSAEKGWVTGTRRPLLRAAARHGPGKGARGVARGRGAPGEATVCLGHRGRRGRRAQSPHAKT